MFPRLLLLKSLAFLAILVLAPALPAWAQGTGAVDRTAIQTVISGQIKAFQADDGAAAYAAASPAIKRLFPNAQTFMGMVTGQYPSVYRPRSVTFGSLLTSPDGPVQQVFLVGPDGVSYVAEYLMQQQPDGSWKINGVSIVPDGQPSI